MPRGPGTEDKGEHRESFSKSDFSSFFQFPSLGPAPDVKIVPDRDGYFSIEFTNAGMSGVREITNEFSRHGEIVKVQQGGARNAVKRVTVSYADLDSAMAALTHYANSNDYRGITFTHECECVEMDT